MNARLSASLAALLAFALLCGCAKNEEAASTDTEEASSGVEVVPDEEATPATTDEPAPQE
jgi:hypothetical protein